MSAKEDFEIEFEDDLEDDIIHSDGDIDDDDDEEEQDDYESDPLFASDDDDDEEDEEEGDDELAEFSAEQRKKIEKKLKRIQEERDEAMRVAAQADAKAQRALARAQNADKVAVGELKQSAEANLKRLKEQLKEAIELDDADLQVELNEKIADALMKKRSAEEAQEAIEAAPAIPEGVIDPPRPGDEDRWRKWMEKNRSWFDPSGNSGDVEMTATAMGIDMDLKRRRVRVNSPEYYEEIDRRMRQRYPDKFPKPKKAGNGAARGGTASSPVSRRSPNNPGKTIVRLTPTQRAVAKRLNLTPEQYMKAYIQYEKEHG